MSVFSIWKEAIKHRKRDKWLIQEFPKLALAQFEGLRDVMPSASKEELYEPIIHSFAEMFGVSYENRDKYTDQILHSARLADSVQPFGLRMVVVSLICSKWSLKSELSIAVAITSVSEVIPENL